jgi:ABC-type multidrug transport system fused ATPase/permease subunit
MGFILDGLDTEAYDRQYSDATLLRRITTYFRPYAGQMAIVAGAITLNAVAGAAGPVLISKSLDVVSTNPALAVLLLLTGAVLLLGVLAWGFNFVQQLFSARVVGNVVLQLREDVFNATIGHDLSFFDEFSSGRIVSRITSDTQDFSDVVTLVTNLISQVTLVLVLAVVLVSINLWLTLILLAFAPIAVAIALSFRRLARRVTLDARKITATINSQIQESISGIMVAKSFRQEKTIYRTFSQNNRQGYKVGLKRGLTLNSIFPVLGASSGVGVAMLIYAGGLSIRSGVVTSGEWYLFMQAVGFFWFPLISIASFWSQFQDGLSASERVFALIDAEPKVRQTAALSPVITAPLRGKVEFRRVHFAYNTNEIVLPDFSLTIAPRETVALVGHTGAGKSSIIKLINRFYEFQGGELLVDGQDIRSLDLNEYRRQIGLVTQTPFLFGATVRENIAYGRPSATDEEIMQAALGISHGTWLADLPHGLDTDAGERGANLSLGQRQLVALARVLLKDPAIFILDEATASVDPFTEVQIQEGLNVVMQNRTTIVIAHRLSTIKHADRILVMDHGQIVEEGAHAALMAGGGRYAELYDTYFRHQSLSYIERFIDETEA